ncbi:MAG: phenylalanine--tRNA ligase subunit alpha [Candidatus Magasanikbacteria bacterium]|jgi:phenylalanyl-tRNA synthetase alpha chain|nr:phenylalanine--tRNA ligase subunit alpha [Candidatus Magasanikbacteria bacterium]MBT4071244.1 phenylalanine--tRNA ligase subunit alpha [Candidatus Magasanikbacteria bacterium]
MKEQFEQIKKDFLIALDEVKDTLMLEELEQRFFSRRSGEMTTVMKNLKDLSNDARKEFGQFANVVKKELQGMISERSEELKGQALAELEKKETIDVTQPAIPAEKIGHMHPMSIINKELEELFTSMGFMVLDGPELESDYYAFETLNIPSHHPARESMDTFYVKDNPHWVMRPHTSPVQVRAMHKYGAPLRTVVPGRCFRNEATDGNHEHTFYQMEGLIIDKDLSISNLIGIMKGLLEGILKKEVEVRLRPGHFPFVEPGFELDMKCFVCGGDGCSACKHSGWVEIIPCGLVHPHVIKAGGLDPEVWGGFAFGLGSMRLVMQRYGIEDIRHFMSGDMRFLNQF